MPSSGRSTRLRQRLKGLALDMSALRSSREYRLLFGGQWISFIGSQITIVAAPYQVFLLTHSSLAVGLLSLCQLIPLLALSLYGGALADVFDRRRMLIVTSILLALTSAMLAAGAFYGHPPLWYIYVVATAASGIAALDQPARRAAVPRLVPRDQIANAFALGQVQNQTSRIIGPAIAGVILARFGLGVAYSIDTLSFGAAIVTILMMRPIPTEEGAQSTSRFAAILEGLSFLRDKPVLTAAFAIDLIAMIFGFPKALFPALALQVFHAGPNGLGLLYAAPSVGSLSGALLTGWIAKVRYQGRATVLLVCLWGLAITGFGLSTGHLWLGLIFLAIGGSSDVFSAVFRNTILQMSIPDRLRGRLSALQYVVISAGPRLGDTESGVVAALTNVRFSVISGGVLSIIGAVLLGLCVPAFMHYDSTKVDPEAVVAS
jgi:MFS family permease